MKKNSISNLQRLLVLVLFFSHFAEIQGQNMLLVHSSDSNKSNHALDFGTIAISKPFGKSATYNVRFNGIQVQDSLKSILKFEIDFIDDNNPRPLKSKNAPFAAVVWNHKQDNTEFLELSIHLPENYYSMSNKHLHLNVLIWQPVKSRNSGDFELFRELNLKVKVDFEQSDTLTLTQWKSGKYPGMQVVSAKQNSDLLEVKIHPKGSRKVKTYQINMLAHEKFVYHTPPSRSTLTFGIMTIPLKSYLAQTYFNEMVQTNFANFAFHIGLLNNEIHTIRADGQYHRKTIGAGLFLHPSVQTVSRLRVSSPDTQLIILEEPHKAPFLGFGLDLNMSYNGLTLHLIPMAFDFQLHQPGNSRAVQSHVWWFGLGIGYTPSGRFLQRN